MTKTGRSFLLVLVFLTVISLPCVLAAGSEDEFLHGCTLSSNITLVKPDWVDTQILDDLSENEKKTLLSIRLIEGTRVYVMTYYGDYGSSVEKRPYQAHMVTSNEETISVACSSFFAFSPEGNPILGYNNDEPKYKHNVIVFTNKPGAYATVSMTLESFTRFQEYAENPSDLTLRQRALDLPHFPFDGINEHGVVIVPMAESNGDGIGGSDPSKITIGRLGAIRKVLDYSQTVQQAIDQLKSVNIFIAGVGHRLICDAYGNSAIVEWKNGEAVVVWRDGPFQICTNSTVAGHQNIASYWSSKCFRYTKYTELLTGCNGIVTEEQAMGFLKTISRTGGPGFRPPAIPLWSSVYNSTNGTWNFVRDCKWDNVYRISLPMVTDLSIADVQLKTNKSGLVRGGTVRLYADLQNKGIRPTGKSAISFYMSRSGLVDDSAIFLKRYELAPVPSGDKLKRQNARTKIPENIKRGKYHFVAALEPGKTSKDADQSNNIKISSTKYKIK